jgi:Fe-S oxidoreductase
MATYKAEFRSHYYAGRLRPRSAYAFGLIFRWADLLSKVPGLVDLANLTTHFPGLASIAKAVAGIAPERRIPSFARESFQTWFGKQRSRSSAARSGELDGNDHGEVGTGKVILWPDTFNNYFHPDIARAGLEVLQKAGFEVEVPNEHLCCGRPLYDYGMLDLAKHQLRTIVETLKDSIEAGTPVVVLEPSCASVFRDELVNLFPEDANAHRLSRQTFLLSEFLEQRAPDLQLPSLGGKALVHGHCHHKALMKMDDELSLLRKLGLDIDEPDSGCCGMAGGFGFEAGDHYQVSIGAGERVLLPAVRATDDQTMIVADGFSCHEQILQTTPRRPLHLAQVLQRALNGNGHGPDETEPDSEADYLKPVSMIGAGAAAALVAVAIGRWTKNRRVR